MPGLRTKTTVTIALAVLLLGAPAPAAAPDPVPNAPGPQEVIAFLNQTIDWHRRLNADEQLASDPADVAFLNDARPVADQALRLAFDFARADAQLLAAQGSAAGAPDQAGASGRYAALSQSADAAASLVKQDQAEIDSLQDKLQSATGARRRALQSQLDEVRSELALAQTRSQTLHDILQFVSGAGPGGTLSAEIEELQRAVPEAAVDPAAEAKAGSPLPASAPAPVVTTSPARLQPSGLLSLASDLFVQARKRRALDRSLDATDALAQSSKKLRAPFVARLTAIARQGDELAKQADSSDPAQLEQEKRQLDLLNADFRQASAVVLPLGKQSILLTSYKGSLGRWRSAADSQYSVELRSLILRLVFLLLALALVVALAELWRRATLRYVHDSRRRYQFLLLRRIALWCSIALTVAFALASEIGSLATFAGLITAGIALALQNVILAVAGYFFLIGKYGVRTGDRVQIGDVTGEVVDIGLVRLQLLELAGGGATGRVVGFSNSIVFQPGTSFFKQIPGTSFLRHEVRLTLAPDSDYRVAEKRMLRAVESVYADYKERIEQQHRQMQRVLDIPVEAPRPQSRLRLTSAGLEVVIRYPVELQSAADIDDRITRELLNALGQAPRLRLVGSGIPNIQPVIDEPGPAQKVVNS